MGLLSKSIMCLMALLESPTTEDRIERMSIPEPNSGCLLWLGVVGKDGYPQMTPPRGEHRIPVRVARLVLAKKLGYVPNKALHTCDVRCCVNEQHLYDGDDKDNVRDMYNRGRRIIVRDKYGKIT